MKKCEDCGKEIEDKYNVCMDCLTKRKAKAEAGKESEVVHTLEQLNQNLYALRTIAEHILKAQYGQKLVWVKANNEVKGHFEIIKR